MVPFSVCLCVQKKRGGESTFVFRDQLEIQGLCVCQCVSVSVCVCVCTYTLVHFLPTTLSTLWSIGLLLTVLQSFMNIDFTTIRSMKLSLLPKWQMFMNLIHKIYAHRLNCRWYFFPSDFHWSNHCIDLCRCNRNRFGFHSQAISYRSIDSF